MTAEALPGAAVDIVLASSSPRRLELLRMLDFHPLVVDPGPVERAHGAGDDPAAYALEQALTKLRAVASRHAAALTVAADTLVVVNGRVLGKPRGEADARRMLAGLSGRVHEVFTGLALGHGGRERTGVERTRVEFRPLRRDEIARYVESGEPLDKAGAYGIQGRGATFVRRVEGCYFNVVGLPLALFSGFLADLGLLYDPGLGQLVRTKPLAVVPGGGGGAPASG